MNVVKHGPEAINLPRQQSGTHPDVSCPTLNIDGVSTFDIIDQKETNDLGSPQQLVGSVSQCVVLEIGMGESVNPGTQTTYFVLLLLVGPGIDALGMTGKLI